MNVRQLMDLRPQPLVETNDREFFLDTRRTFRLRREGGSAVAVDRDSRRHRLPWPEHEPIPPSEGFAQRIFDICERTSQVAAER